MAREAEGHGLSFEPHLRQSLLEDHTAGAHRSYKGFYYCPNNVGLSLYKVLF